MSGPLAAGTFCHHSQNRSGARGWRKVPSPTPTPAAPQPLHSCGREARNDCTYWGSGVICFIFFNCILIIFFPALDGGGKWVNEYLIKVPSFHLGLSSLLSALGPGARAGQIRLLALYPKRRPHSGADLTQPQCWTGVPALPGVPGKEALM